MKKKKLNYPRLVLDSYPVLVFLFEERGYQKVKKLIRAASVGEVELWMSEINLGEIYYRVWREFDERKAGDVVSRLLEYKIHFENPDREFILSAAKWKAKYAISYADAFAVELAVRKQCPVVTNDTEFDAVEEVEIINI